MTRALLSSVAALGFAGSAFAGTLFTVTLETPRDKAEMIVAAKVLWSCSGNTCTAELARKTVNIRTCKKVAKKIGRIAEFSNAKGALSETDLAACNTSAK